MHEQSRVRTVIEDLAEPSAAVLGSETEGGLPALPELDLLRAMGSAGTTTNPGASDEDVS
jgi:hypothetical protein